MVALLAGVGEELLFRGVIQGGLDGVIGPWPALALASLLFGAMHALSRAYFVLATVMGLYMGLVYLWTGNLLIPILIHFLYDWVVLRYYLASRS
nr:CPBP family intramembrane glutamic endopeptidase [Wenzhouxiangella limi]